MSERESVLFEGLRRVDATCAWSNQELPSCFEGPIRALLDDVIGTLATEGRVPVARTLMPFVTGRAMRPDQHRRAFYVSLPKEFGEGVVAIKGSEPVLHDELSMMVGSGLHNAWVADRRMRVLDVFPAREFKVPLAETLREALGEASVAQELAVAYARRYREVPLLPTPLAVLRWPDTVTKNYFAVVEPELNPFAREVVEMQVERGLGCYIYYYPTSPFPRVRDVARELAGKGPLRFDALRAKEPPIVTVKRWVDLFTRILALGYLPASTTRFVLGQLVQAQNAVVGGGFVDVDSARRMTDFKDWRELIEAYLFSVETFARTIGIFLFDGVEEQSTASPFGFCSIWLTHMIATSLAADIAQYGSLVDPRIQNLPPLRSDLEGFMVFAERFQGAVGPGDIDKLARTIAGQT